MRRALIILIGMVIGMPYAMSQPKICVDERQELSAIVWRLAGCEEYMMRIPPSYEADIEESFRAFSDHPVMTFIRSMRDNSGDVVSYNSVPMAAAVLRIEKGHVRLASSFDLDNYVKQEDPRWTTENLKQYVRLLDDFYRRSKFNRFFNAHRTYYDAYINECQQLYEETVCEEWFEQFYGIPFPVMSVWVSPAYGNHNYALPEIILDAMGLNGVGVLLGMTREPKDTVGNSKGRVLIHEISHYFTNLVFPKYDEMLLLAGEQIYAALPRMLTASGYGSPSSVCGEYLNELCSMLYCRETLDDDLYAAIQKCHSIGFIWAEEGVTFMDNFIRNRTAYPVFEDFMPQLVGFMRGIGNNIEAIKRIYNEPPYVVSTFPASGTTVSTDIKEIRIRFSHPMCTGIIATCGFDDESILSVYDDSWYDSHDDELEYWEDNRTLVIRITAPLEAGKTYGLILPTDLCKENMVPIEQAYNLIFKTAR